MRACILSLEFACHFHRDFGVFLNQRIACPCIVFHLISFGKFDLIRIETIFWWKLRTMAARTMIRFRTICRQQNYTAFELLWFAWTMHQFVILIIDERAHSKQLQQSSRFLQATQLIKLPAKWSQNKENPTKIEQHREEKHDCHSAVCVCVCAFCAHFDEWNITWLHAANHNEPMLLVNKWISIRKSKFTWCIRKYRKYFYEITDERGKMRKTQREKRSRSSEPFQSRIIRIPFDFFDSSRQLFMEFVEWRKRRMMKIQWPLELAAMNAQWTK